MAVGLVAVVVPSLTLLLSSLVRQASAADAEVEMLTLARSQLESVKEQPYKTLPHQTLPRSYTLINPKPKQFSVNVTAALVKTYAYPFPGFEDTLPDQIQLITVQVDCLHCSPPVGSLVLQEYKVRR